MPNSKHLQQLYKSELDSYGYSRHWKLLKSKDIPNLKSIQCESFFDRIIAQTKKSLCQNIDLIIPKRVRSQSDQHQLEQFLKIIGTDISKTSLNSLSNQLIQVDTNATHADILKRERDDEKRAFRIQEFIRTEQSYVETLQTLVRFVVRPLRSMMQQKHCILNTFKCSKIFLNIEQIMRENEAFLKDLVEKKEGFGTICQKHIEKFECYRKYLLEQTDAQQLHTKEFKVNQSYRKFLLKVRDRAEFKRKRLQDILVEPVQRISRYSMMLRDILCLTPEDHPDYKGLKMACEKAKIIATMADDDPTKNATLFLNLYQSIKDSPCSLINQKRSLIAHLDAIEIHRVTNKPTRAVTIFLFTDKILVASRPSLDAKEININDFLTSSQQQKNFTNNLKRRDLNLKFKGWADIESVELFNGPTDRSGSFILSVSTPQEVKDGNIGTTTFEKYFYKGPRLFSVLPAKSEPSRHKISCYLEKCKDFIHQYQMSRALVRQYKIGDRTLHRQWQDIPTYCNVYNPESYIQAKYKNCCALIYVDNNEELEKLFHNKNNSIYPWTVGLIQPDTNGFRFILSHKPGLERPLVSTACEQTLDFESIFWNNLIFLDTCLKQSVEFKERQNFYIQQSLIVDGRTIRRSTSMTRHNGGTIGKLFNNAENKRKSMIVESYHRSRSVSPSKCVIPSRSPPFNSVVQEEERSRTPIHSWSSAPHYSPKRDANNSVSSSLSLELKVETKKNLSKVNAKHETLQTPVEPAYDLPDANINTISSIGSSTASSESCRSSFITLDEKENHGSNIPQNKEYTIANLEPDMDRIFKLTRTFKDEMQQQWCALTAKYELSSDDHSFDIVQNDIKDPLLHYQNSYSYHHQ